MRVAKWDQKIASNSRSKEDARDELMASFLNKKSNADSWGDLFVPTYFSMVIKSFSNIDLRTGHMTLSAVFTVRFMKKFTNKLTTPWTVSEMPRGVFRKLIEDGITITSNEGTSIKIGGQSDQECDQRLVTRGSYEFLVFTKRVTFKAGFLVDPAVAVTPFDSHTPAISFEFPSINLGHTRVRFLSFRLLIVLFCFVLFCFVLFVCVSPGIFSLICVHLTCLRSGNLSAQSQVQFAHHKARCRVSTPYTRSTASHAPFSIFFRIPTIT
jgi:hypothetical protein